ncbi:DUF5703 domain-containing protein [Zunongwangia endophytica]|uniref:DUF5703 domain-containing protein n=1 Tax=Zunongwangia endophytica TaxID=1808945 RepID=A0ABV8HA34_9FLAO|nr:DUF5703 domain-containing protein [Zunongwangia endophytica]MDN3594836.1 DUF5703 domain-containing protein [Zunongwangia endophytica]
MKNILFVILFFVCSILQAQIPSLGDYNPVWTNQSTNSSESMPVGGGDIGMNVWVENGSIFAYFSRSGTFDEHNTFLKLGRLKLELEPNPFKESERFRQELKLRDGYIEISDSDTNIRIWIDVYNPVIHLEVESAERTKVTASYENWRHEDKEVKGKANNANSYKWAPQDTILTYADSINFNNDGIQFYHRNRDSTVFDVAVKQQGMEAVKNKMMNPLKNLTFGGFLHGENFKPSGVYYGKYQNTNFKGYSLESRKALKNQKLQVQLYTDQIQNIDHWKEDLSEAIKEYKGNVETAHSKSIKWWNAFWDRSFIYVQKKNSAVKDSVYQIGQNYQLFRYMLGCNAYGEYPTKFNGGLFTYDPVYIDSTYTFTPDFRNWGGGTMTAQNQRLVYFPMLKSGDFDMMPSQLKFYQRMMKNAELRSEVYWGHGGASFTEQIENYGLPNPSEYGWDRPKDYDQGLQYNAWLEHQWDTILEFCLMMLDQHYYIKKDISEYLPLVMSSLKFFDNHYQYLAGQRGSKKLDAQGKLVLYPGSAAETYKMAYNANSTIAALQVITKKLLSLPEEYLLENQKKYLSEFKERIPPISFRQINNQKVIAPAENWERINNTEVPQLYPVFPWGIYGLGKPDLGIAKNTFKLDPDVQNFRSHIGWKQDNIFAARLGFTAEAAKYTKLKLANSGRKFPAFWGPGFDWVPDHNWGGSGMIGLQEMLLQTAGNKILLFPSWPQEWNVHFKLHAVGNVIIEAKVENGVSEIIAVSPVDKRKDIINLYSFSAEEKQNLNVQQ